ncbi:adenylyl-sulfate kinase [Paenibacillus sp. 481]|uniref:adenylyl-sulfate kinase n=1 Tax=Paenibacillus sp. 481 TaxID=2835869 RepID=UPI001E5D760C|nr:adenylyl-sulfate kinase [Paenibacillus sp. 481]UHA73550.1 adenylyl-sulfate kinase [Paenibacillus sp. 481]
MGGKQRGVTVWFTGLSGAGKTTIAKCVHTRLTNAGLKAECLDGDVIRTKLCNDLGFSKQDRHTNIERVSYVAQLLTKHDVICLASLISPYRSMRQYAKEEIGDWLEVYVTAPLELLIARDVKGLYRKAIAGEILHFTGISDPYEPPLAPDLVLETDQQDVQACAQHVIDLLANRGYITRG